MIKDLEKSIFGLLYDSSYVEDSAVFDMVEELYLNFKEVKDNNLHVLLEKINRERVNGNYSNMISLLSDTLAYCNKEQLTEF